MLKLLYRYAHIIVLLGCFSALVYCNFYALHGKENGGCGTSFFINSKGTLVTANHVVGSHKYVMVWLNKGMVIATVVYHDTNHDIAVLQTSLTNTNYLGFDLTPVVSNVAVYGYPRPDLFGYNLKHRVGTGTLSILHRYYNYDVVIYPGNSGGPIVDSNGGVVGLVAEGYYDLFGKNSKSSSGFGPSAYYIFQDIKKAGYEPTLVNHSVLINFDVLYNQLIVSQTTPFICIMKNK